MVDHVREGLDPSISRREITFEAGVVMSVTPFLKVATVHRGGAGHMTFACPGTGTC